MRTRKSVGWARWKLINPDVCPVGFERCLEVGEDGVQYAWAPGIHCADLPFLHRKLRDHVWRDRFVDYSDKARKRGWEDYIEYVRTIWGQFELDNDFPGYGVVTHGDCTMENLLVHNGELRMIDPGDPRGLHAQELDEAKLLQSFCTHWEVWRRGWPLTEYPETYFRGLDRRVHLQLLLSHWLRLNRHHPSSYAEFVIHECKRLLNLHRSRWDPYRFSLQCASFLLRGDSEGHR